ncbi:hypothetical protein QE429_003867 [Bacillus sp. SORGH_AS 510]|uniref:hypothetical protein n=1 Tax=Bacillus sp. SORGH_AS_0510 TaxID=3041771 RepID=UPI002787A871|nr:hypothetical protein [Bacillus sp. SORGH_AS_0510]MDQ1147040.1 hypothetical protein [Bacillus sp. SORGH_AS_0510]
MKKLSKSAVKSSINKNGLWTGFLVTSKLNPFQISGCWSIGFKVSITNLDDLERALVRFTYANSNDEVGNSIFFYEN